MARRDEIGMDLVRVRRSGRARRGATQAIERASRRQVKTESIWSRLGSAAIGFIGGGPAGAAAGFITDPIGRGGDRPTRPPAPPRGFISSPGGHVCDELPLALRSVCEGLTRGGGGGVKRARCAEGEILVGDTCVRPGDAFPGGAPFTRGAGGTAVEGGFGLPAMTPVVEMREHRTCPDGMVLGKDELCYPKAILRRNSKFRKWRSAPRPKISAADWKTLKRAERVRDASKEVAKTAGFKVSKR